MGRSVARLLAERGANVVIVARNVDKLKSAVAYISVCENGFLLLLKFFFHFFIYKSFSSTQSAFLCFSAVCFVFVEAHTLVFYLYFSHFFLPREKKNRLPLPILKRSGSTSSAPT
jgi:hypothetical protein